MSDKLSDEQIVKLAEQFGAWSNHGYMKMGEKRLVAFARALLAASPAPAIPAEPVPPFGWVQPRGGNYFTRSEVAAKRIGGLMPVYASPPASIAPAISESEDARDAARYRHLRAYYTQVVFMQEDGPSVDLQAISEIGDAYEMQVLDAAIDAARKENQS
ncbi:hypothetical protein [Burkholderia glumae]|uniref:hypothetical protein n=1 Tax=Burkholderia glumae TaxID=337 RepID=UPI00214FA15B|nr:hypothetical protein [Burkholderia glumae]